MKVLLRTVSVIITLSISLDPCYSQDTDSIFMKSAYLKMERSIAYTIEIATLMPAKEYTFRPSSDQMTFASQLLHLAQNLGWLSSSYLNQNDTNPVTAADLKLTNKDSIRLVLNKAFDYALKSLGQFPHGQLKEQVDFFAGPMNKLQIINLMNDHHTHHRGQLIVYLRMKSIKPPPYRGW